MDLKTANPIFIVGAPRSGTSLLRTILNRHPRIALCDETYYFYSVYHRRRAFGDLSRLENRRRLVDCYLATHGMRRLGGDLEALREAMLSEGEDYASLFLALLRSYASAKGKQRYGEKTPQHALESKTLCQLYPGCRLIHLVRDPRDVVASLLRMPWGSASVAANARLWRACVEGAEQCQREGGFLRVNYADLINNPSRQVQQICDFLGEPFLKSMLEADPNGAADHWWFERAQQPLSKDRMERWRQELNPDQVRVVEWVANPWLEKLGYRAVGPGASAGLRLQALLGECWEGLGKNVRSLPRLWIHWLQPTRLEAEEAWIDRSHRRTDTES